MMNWRGRNAQATDLTVSDTVGVALTELPARPHTRGTVAVGMTIVAVFFGGFGAWTALAPLSSAAIAPGAVQVQGYRKTVQHLEGGIIRALEVRDGDTVTRGQLLMRLDPTQAEAHYQAQLSQYLTLKAEEARLWAERDGAEHISFPKALSARRDEPRVAANLASQRRLFDSRRRSLNGRIAILAQRIGQLRSQTEGLTGQVAAEDRQIALLSEETVGAQTLFDQGYEGNTRLLELKRNGAAVEVDRAGHLAEIAQAEQAMGETRLEIINLRDERDAETATELKDVQARLAELEEALGAAQDILRRTEILAPIAGVVMDMKFFTLGGVIEPGVAILDIVPQGDDLVAEVQISPLDIDVVQRGLKAQIRLTAFKQRKTPVLNGVVIDVSADSMVDEHTDMAYYKVFIEIDAQELARVADVDLYPGMPVEGIILTGSRTLWRYLIGPIEDSFALAFREQ